MRIVVTGASGFIGWHLVRALAERGDTVEAWSRSAVDITDPDAVAQALTRFAPEAIFHLAAQSLPGRSWDEPAETYRVNVGGAIALLEAARLLARAPRLLMAGSSAEYADAADGIPITEEAPLEPNSPYGNSKLAATRLGHMYGRRYGLDIVGFRPFFLAGPRKTGDVCSDFARGIVAVERGTRQAVPVGDLTVVRDIIDVRDGVAGLLTLLDAGTVGEVYNISGGHGISIGEILEAYCELATVTIPVAEDSSLRRPLEQRVRIGDSTKLRKLGWAPRYDIRETLKTILDYWRSQ